MCAGRQPAGDDGFPRVLVPVDIRVTEAAGVGEDVVEGDLGFAAIVEFRNDLDNRCVWGDEIFLPQLSECHGYDRFCRGHPKCDRIGCHFDSGFRLAPASIDDDVISELNIDLRAQVMAPGALLFEYYDRFWKTV